MQVKVVKSRAEKEELKVIPFTSMSDAIAEATRVAEALSDYRKDMPRIREGTDTFALCRHDGIRTGSKSHVSLQGASRLIAKGRAILDVADAELKANLASHADEVAAAILFRIIKRASISVFVGNIRNSTLLAA